MNVSGRLDVDARPVISPERYGHRLERARELAAESGLAALLIGVGADLVYLTGYDAKPLERLTMLALPAKGRPTLVAPRLEGMPARSCPGAIAQFVDVKTWNETEDPIDLVIALTRDAIGAATPSLDRLAVSDHLWASFVLGFQARLPGTRFELASSVTSRLRLVKDSEEIALLRLAARAADRVVGQIAAGRLVGRTERDVSREVADRLIDEGHETAAFGIVASGPNSASPHHSADSRVIQAGEPIVLDIGGHLGGYASDTTRTIWVTGGDPANGPDDEFLRLYELVRRANAEATAAVLPGVPVERIDSVARAMIEAGGYGAHFSHRVGHGIGLDGHEEPYLVAGNAEPLVDGAAFSIEPGIYVEGRYGARVEDIVVCTPDGALVLNESSRDLFVVPG